MKLFRRGQGRPASATDKRSGGALRAAGDALRDGVGATGRQLSAGSESGSRLDDVLRAVLRPMLVVVTVLARLLAAALSVALPLLERLRIALARLIEFGARELTPVRMLALVAIGAAILLALSQFADYRGIGVGADKYRGVEAVAPPPEVARAETGSAHAYAFVPAALIAIGAIVLALRGRWRLTRIASLVGIAALVVGIVFDRATGLDEGAAAITFQGPKAVLLGGFWAELAAGATLTITALLLGAELRADATERRPTRSPGMSARRPVGEAGT